MVDRGAIPDSHGLFCERFSDRHTSIHFRRSDRQNRQPDIISNFMSDTIPFEVLSKTEFHCRYTAVRRKDTSQLENRSYRCFRFSHHFCNSSFVSPLIRERLSIDVLGTMSAEPNPNSLFGPVREAIGNKRSRNLAPNLNSLGGALAVLEVPLDGIGKQGGLALR